MNKNDILTRLMNGESAEDIAKEMTAMLNDATKAYADQKKDKEKMARAEAVADAINDYAAYVGYKGAELKGEDVIKVMDSFLKFYKDPHNFKIEIPGFRFETRTDKPTKKGKTVDEIINDWISRI
jgi:hypothetical protein